LRDLRDYFEEFYIFLLKNFIKTFGLTVQQRSKKLALYETILALNRQRQSDAIRSKVKGKNKTNLFKIMVEAFGCALGISQEYDIVATPDQQPKSKALLGTSKGLAWGSC